MGTEPLEFWGDGHCQALQSEKQEGESRESSQGWPGTPQDTGDVPPLFLQEQFLHCFFLPFSRFPDNFGCGLRKFPCH